MKLNMFYNKRYNIDLGLLNYLHPFDGLKFQKVESVIQGVANVTVCTTKAPVGDTEINSYVDDLQKLLLKKKGYICRALEVPKIPFVPFSWLDNKVLLPMRWAVAGTIEATRKALAGENCWNLGGGFHHANKAVSEGFCIYNDIGITYQVLCESNELTTEDKILIIDTDAHHGNGNAYSFMESANVTLCDIYNGQIYPNNKHTKQRLDINVPLASGTSGTEYLSKLDDALNNLKDHYKLAFVVAGTDVLGTDPLGGLNLTIDESATRDARVAKRLNELGIPFVFLGGGGYSKQSAEVMALGIKKVAAI